MINTGEEKTLCFTIYVPHEKWRVDKEYSAGKIVWWNSSYYEYQNVAASTGTLPNDSAVWTLLSGRKKLDCQYITKLTIELFYRGEAEFIAQYSLNAMTGYGDVDDSDVANSTYKVELTKDQTRNLKEGDLMATLKYTEDLPGVGEKDRNPTPIFVDYINIVPSAFTTPA